MNRLIFLLSLTFFTINTSSFAQQLDVNQINVIKETAAAICDTVKEAKGIKTEFQLQGEIQAKLKGLAGKLANIGVEGKGNYGNESFEGLSREATASALEGDRGCRERVFNKMFDKLESSSGPPEPSIGFTDKWAGSWLCKCDTHEMYLTITGKGWSSSLNANYPKAYGNKPATEEYITKNISKSSVSGEYLYKDASPNTGYQSQRGLWKGNWIITKESNNLHLTRKDYTTSWQGEYRCSRK